MKFGLVGMWLLYVPDPSAVGALWYHCSKDGEFGENQKSEGQRRTLGSTRMGPHLLMGWLWSNCSLSLSSVSKMCIIIPLSPGCLGGAREMMEAKPVAQHRDSQHTGEIQ